MILMVNSQKWYDAAIATWFVEDSKLAADHGHINLIAALETLLECAKNKHFHDFASEDWAPKINLRNQLLHLAYRVVNGDFDN